MGLNIIVCIKAVSNPGAGGRAAKPTGNVDLNFFDRPALEMALSLIESHGGTVTVLSMGPDTATYALYQAMAMGAHQGILICDRALRESDTYVTALTLGTALKKISPFNLVLFGTRSSDSDTGHVGPQTAQMLNIPFLINVHALKLADGVITVKRKADGYDETFELTGPAGFTIHPNFKEPGFTGLYGIESTFQSKTIERWDIKKLGLNPDEIGISGSPTKIAALEKQTTRHACRFIDGTEKQQAETLTRILSKSGLIG